MARPSIYKLLLSNDQDNETERSQIIDLAQDVLKVTHNYKYNPQLPFIYL